MIRLTAQQIAAAIGARQLGGSPDAAARGVTIDSRRTAPGDVFFAIVGERLDGHDFVDKAAQAGATLVVVDDQHAPAQGIRTSATNSDASVPVAILQVEDTTTALQALASWVRQQLDPTVVAITGSLGKTTTKELTSTLLGLHYDVHATPGNLNNHWGLPLSLLGLQAHHQTMVAELAMSHAGEIRALARLARPDVGLITNVAPAHMQNFADLDAVAAAKGELAEELPATGTLVVNADDERTAAMPGRRAAHVERVLRFGLDPTADVRAEAVRRVGAGWSLTLCAGGVSHAIELHLPSPGGVSSFLGAAAVAWALDVPLDLIAAKAPQLAPLSNRGALRHAGGIDVLDESYNASPVAVAAALDTLAALPAVGRKVAVLGDMLEMGDWSERVHREVGRHAADVGVDLLVAVGDFSPLVVEGAAAGGMEPTNVQRFDTAAEAAHWLAPRVRRGDAVLVKGSRAVHLEEVVNAVTAAPSVANRVAGG